MSALPPCCTLLLAFFQARTAFCQVCVCVCVCVPCAYFLLTRACACTHAPFALACSSCFVWLCQASVCCGCRSCCWRRLCLCRLLQVTEPRLSPLPAALLSTFAFVELPNSFCFSFFPLHSGQGCTGFSLSLPCMCVCVICLRGPFSLCLAAFGCAPLFLLIQCLFAVSLPPPPVCLCQVAPCLCPVAAHGHASLNAMQIIECVCVVRDGGSRDLIGKRQETVQEQERQGNEKKKKSRLVVRGRCCCGN